MGQNRLYQIACILVLFLSLIIAGCSNGGGNGNNDANPAPPPTDAISNKYLQYRTFENASSNRFQGWIEITKSGAPIQQADVNEILMTDSAGNEVNSVGDPVFDSYSWILYDCTGGTCTNSGQIEGSGFTGIFNNLPADTYHVEVRMADGQTLTTEIPYDGELELPVVKSATMTSTYSNGDLELSWTNPTGEANWDKVEQLRITLYDSNGADVLAINADPTPETITIPAALLNEAAALGNGSLARWQIQTRAIDQNGMNYARGFSNQVLISGYVAYSYFLQYRNYESNPATSNRYSPWLGIYKDNQPASPADVDVNSFKITNDSGSLVTLVNPGFSVGSNYIYDCRQAQCADPYLALDSGFSARITDLPAGKYRLEAKSSDGTATVAVEVEYGGKLVLPYVKMADLSYSYNQFGDLVLTWTNPVTEANWGLADELRIILLGPAPNYTELMYIRTSTSAQTVTLPKLWLGLVNSLPDGPIAYWYIQTRSFDDSGMNDARAYSALSSF